MPSAASTMHRVARTLAAASAACVVGAAAVAVAVAAQSTPAPLETPAAASEAAPADQVAAVLHTDDDPHDDPDDAPAAPSAAEVVGASSPSTTVVAPPVEPPVTAPVVAAAAAPAPAPAATPDQRGREALALISYPIDRLGYSISFVGPRNGYLGLTSTTAKTITIYVRPAQSTLEIAKVVAHELGHAVDVEHTSDAERALYRQIRGIDGRSWYPNCSGCTDYNSVAGDFAEVFARWLLGDVSYSSTVTAVPDAAQLAALSPIFTV